MNQLSRPLVFCFFFVLRASSDTQKRKGRRRRRKGEREGEKWKQEKTKEKKLNGELNHQHENDNWPSFLSQFFTFSYVSNHFDYAKEKQFKIFSFREFGNFAKRNADSLLRKDDMTRSSQQH